MIDVFELATANRAGARIGLPSFCTANEIVLRAILGFAREHDLPVLIEATCNQVNQFGGYTGMRPREFPAMLKPMALDAGLAEGALIMGGDHLGPNPWKTLPADQAMDHAREMIRQYAEAGFTKIHLDASMPLGGEPMPSSETVAKRAADLCKVAERAAPEADELFYIIGTEVPVPGGETETLDEIGITKPDSLAQTILTHREAFDNAGLSAVWGKVLSIVVQPGVDFNHSSVITFDPVAAWDLISAILDAPDLTFEAHSTDLPPRRIFQSKKW